MKTHLNRDAVPFAPRAIYPQNSTLVPPVSPIPTPGLTSHASDVSTSECQTPTEAGFNVHSNTDSARSKGRPRNRTDIFSATHPDPLLTGSGPLPKTRKVRTRVVFTPDDHATPFVPSIVRQRAEVAKEDIEEQKGEQVNLKQWLPDADWIFPFRSASSNWVIRTNELRKDKLIPLVQKGNWDFASLSQLAGMFIDRVVESSSDYEADNSTNALAHFAILVYDEFCMQVSPQCGLYFMEALRSCLLSEFRAWWLARNPCSAVNLTINSPCPPHKPPLYNLATALTIAKFVGDLFSWGGCSAMLVKLCLDIVAHDLSCIEEVECIFSILERCDKVLYQQVRMTEYLKRVQSLSAKMHNNSASCYDPPVKHVIDSLVKRITNFIEGWASTEMEPAVSSPLESDFEEFRPDAEEREHFMDIDEDCYMDGYKSYPPPQPTPPPPEPTPMLPPVPQPTQATTFRAAAAQVLSYWPALPPPDVRYINPIVVAQAAYLRRVANGLLAPPAQHQSQVLAQFEPGHYQEEDSYTYDDGSE